MHSSCATEEGPWRTPSLMESKIQKSGGLPKGYWHILSLKQRKIVPHKGISPAWAVWALYPLVRKCSRPILTWQVEAEKLCMRLFFPTHAMKNFLASHLCVLLLSLLLLLGLWLYLSAVVSLTNHVGVYMDFTVLPPTHLQQPVILSLTHSLHFPKTTSLETPIS